MEISALILAGGKSRRMKGDNKAFLSYKDKIFIENIVEALKGVEDIHISVDDKSKYKSLNYPLIEDEYKEIGPIGGMYSAFKKINSEFIIVLACDMPKVNEEFIKFLIENVNEDDRCVCVDIDDRLYPLGAVYNRNILFDLEESIKKKDYKLGNLIKKINGRIIELKENDSLSESLINVNDPEEYKKLNKY